MKDQDTERVLELVHDSRTANSILDVSKRFTLLHVAVLQGNNAVIEHLLKHGAHTDPLSVHGVTPLFAAVAKGELHAVKLLVGAGANVNMPASNGCVFACLFPHCCVRLRR
jgi:ankyrin repeat protein